MVVRETRVSAQRGMRGRVMGRLNQVLHESQQKELQVTGKRNGLQTTRGQGEKESIEIVRPKRNGKARKIDSGVTIREGRRDPSNAHRQSGDGCSKKRLYQKK